MMIKQLVKLAITRRFLPLENLHLNSRLAKTDLQVQTFQKLYRVQLVWVINLQLSEDESGRYKLEISLLNETGKQVKLQLGRT